MRRIFKLTTKRHLANASFDGAIQQKLLGELHLANIRIDNSAI